MASYSHSIPPSTGVPSRGPCYLYICTHIIIALSWHVIWKVESGYQGSLWQLADDWLTAVIICAINQRSTAIILIVFHCVVCNMQTYSLCASIVV